MRLSMKALMISLLAVFAIARSAGAQSVFGTARGETPVLEVSAGYTYVYANAPPGQCGCFSANGGYGSAAFGLPHGVSIVADLAAVHASTVGGTTQSITLFHYLFGARYTLRSHRTRLSPYVQALGGGAEEFSSYAAVQHVRGAAFSLGGGASVPIGTHFSWTMAEADWVRSELPNAQNNFQNDLRLSSGINFRLGPR
jgi:hypothetical protein